MPDSLSNAEVNYSVHCHLHFLLGIVCGSTQVNELYTIQIFTLYPKLHHKWRDRSKYHFDYWENVYFGFTLMGIQVTKQSIALVNIDTGSALPFIVLSTTDIVTYHGISYCSWYKHMQEWTHWGALLLNCKWKRFQMALEAPFKPKY
jgi:hypothetical protein